MAKKSGSKSSGIPMSRVKQSLKDAGAKLVSKSAIKTMKKEIDSFNDCMAKKAVQMTKHGKRKKVMGKDVTLAAKYSDSCLK